MKQTVCPNCGGLLRTESHGWICNKCKGFISLQDGKFYEYVENPFLPPMTNADRLRAMTDEELAKECVKQFPMYLWPTEVRTIYFDFDNHNKNNAINAWIKWLQQPAEGDA